MAENTELKPKSFRIDDETNEKLKLIMKDFPNQNLALQKIVEVYEFQQSKEVVSERKADIEEFEKYVSCLVRMYMSSLESNQNQKELIRSEFDSQLRIMKEKLENIKQEKEEIALKTKKISSENEQLKEFNEKLNAEYKTKINNLQDILKEKEESNSLLKSANAELKMKVEQMKEEIEQNKEFHQKFEDLIIEYDNLSMFYNSLQKDFEKQQEMYEKELTELKKHENEVEEYIREQEQIKLEKMILELQKEHQAQIQQLKEQNQKEIDKYQNKYLSLLEQIERAKSTSTHIETTEK